MEFLLVAVVVFIFASYFIIKSARGSADRGEAPDISDPSSAPDNIGSDQSSGNDGDGGD